MRQKTVERLAKNHLLTHLPGYEVARGIIHATPITDVLRGFAFESSAFDSDVAYVWAFAQPLYVPRDSLVFTFGRRLRRSLGLLRSTERWDLREERAEASLAALAKTLTRDGVPLVKRLESPELLVQNLQPKFGASATIFHLEAVAYSLARLGRYREAEQKLGLLSDPRKTQRWPHVRDNANALLEAIRISPARAEELLNEWKVGTCAALHLSPDAAA